VKRLVIEAQTAMMHSNPDRQLFTETVNAERNAASPHDDTDDIVHDILNNHLNDFVSHATHTEEDPIVQKESRMRNDPNAVDKLTDVTNIEFDFASPTVDASKIDTFVVKVKRVREYMNVSCVIKEARSSLRINENALGQQLFNPCDLPLCSLHARMCMVERVIKMLILAGMRLAVIHNKLTEYCQNIEDVVNTDILARSSANAVVGQWRVPMDKNDPKKLGDVKLSADRANKFMNNFDPLVDVCTNGYDPAFTSEWKDCCSQFVHVIGLLKGKWSFAQRM